MRVNLHARYEHRIAGDADRLLVYGDLAHNIFLGVVTTQAQAVRLLDAYDQQLGRRQYIADQMRQRAQAQVEGKTYH